MRVVIPVVVILGALAGLIGMAVATMGTPEVYVHQMVSGEQFIGREVKVQGVIAAIHNDVRPLRFSVRDKEHPDQVLEVEIDDVRPDIFEVGNDVAVIGALSSRGGVLAGTKIFTKCPSKYEPAEGEEGAYGEDGSPQDPKAEPTPKPEASANDA